LWHVVVWSAGLAFTFHAVGLLNVGNVMSVPYKPEYKATPYFSKKKKNIFVDKIEYVI
jgi:hypothetical protein